MAKRNVKQTAAVSSNNGYQSRADLLAANQKQAKQIAKLKADLLAKVDDSNDDQDMGMGMGSIDSLPDVPADGVPFRPSIQKTPSTRTAAAQTLQTQVQNILNGTVTIHPTPYVRSLFAKPRRGLGGFQSLHAALQHRMGGSKTLDLSGKDFARVINYAVNYGEGGFQQSLRWLVALWAAENLAGQSQNASQNG